jgi:hypothetical protein
MSGVGAARRAGDGNRDARLWLETSNVDTFNKRTAWPLYSNRAI